jgi:protein-S-isoprenylcysteine O-methyltransferase Ste14
MSSSPSLPIESPAPRVVGQLAYGALFAIVLPLLLGVWATVLDRRVTLPAIGSPRAGLVLAIAGAFIALAGVIALRVRGGGWPMSPYPPRRLVTSGIYALVAHPLYLGSVLLAGGVFVVAGSGSGIWIVTPVLAASCIAFVWGSEAERTEALFGARAQPLIHLPAASDEKPVLSDRISVCLLALLPWYVVYEGINRLGPWRDAFGVGATWEAVLPVIGWTEVLYFLAYPIVLAAPFVARSRRDLREFVFRAWLATAASAVCYLAIPTSFATKPVPVTPFASLMEWERTFDTPNTHFPAFHVIWVLLTIDVYGRAFPRARRWHWPIAIAVAASCVTTGMHAIADVVVGLLFGWIFLRIERVWRAVARGAERLSHSRAEWRVGPLRVINHGAYAGVAVAFGAGLITALAGEESRGAVVLVAIAAMAGAALWAQWVEGSPSLLRPYGYYGGLIAGIAMIAISGGGLRLLAAYAVAAPLIQAIGRLRCLVQGCCHGRPTKGIGTRVTHPQSRIVKIAHLSGIVLHPTAVYSILAGLVMGALLLRLWIAGAPVAFVAGAYLILSSLARFVEEHYRGEPQTRFVAGLRLYQWMSIVGVVAGALLTTLPSPAAPPIEPLSLSSVWIALATGAVAFLAYGVDFPASNRRFARLS